MLEIRDPVHGTIEIEQDEIAIVDSKYFQRLRNIKQLGFLELSFPGATHNRYIHSLGAMFLSGKILEAIFKKNKHYNDEESKEKILAFRKTLRIAALLHDIGHGPLSHSSELAMPLLKTLNLPYSSHSDFENLDLLEGEKLQRANHEDYTSKIILDSSLTIVLEKTLKPFGATPKHIAALVNPRITIDEEFFMLNGTNFRTLMNQILSSEIDCDRMDYLLRDAYYTGVSYGTFDINWLLGNLTFSDIDGKAHLCVEHRGLYSFDDFLLSRYHMFLMIYYHYKSVIFDEMLVRFLKDPSSGYKIPASVEHYIEYDDTHLYTFLRKSSNEWAQRIVNVKPYKMISEIHSGIIHPHAGSIDSLREASKKLHDEKIDNILTTSTGKISKYFKKSEQNTGEKIFVHYGSHPQGGAHVPIEEATDLFSAYEKARTITRLYVAKENEERAQKILNLK